VNFRKHVALILVLAGTNWLTASSSLAQTRSSTLTLHFTAYSPLIALIAGILILIVPRLLNYIVAIYLILVGLIGIFGL
jgi:hypothetical protein